MKIPQNQAVYYLIADLEAELDGQMWVPFFSWSLLIFFDLRLIRLNVYLSIGRSYGLFKASLRISHFGTNQPNPYQNSQPKSILLKSYFQLIVCKLDIFL